MKLLLFLAALALLFVVACGDSSDEDDPIASPSLEASACGTAKAHEAGEFDQTITSGGLERTYILHVPPGYDGETKMPLVVLLHGFALNGRIMLDYSGFGAIADREGFVLISPTGLGDPPRWNSRVLPQDPGDLTFLTELMDGISTMLCIDTERVFATGYSNGGGMSMRLACDIPDKIKAVGLVASVFIECAPKAPLIAFHGIQDALVGFEGGSSFPPIRDAVATWAEGLGCAAEPDVTKHNTHIELSIYNDCTSGDGAVQFYVVDGGGHTWPGADLFNDTTITTQEIDMSELIWQFFSGVQP